MTLRCLNARYPTVVDPCDWPPSVKRRYRNYSIHFVRAPGEELDQQHLALTHYDEVWLYNVLQHVQDPARVVANAIARVAPKPASSASSSGPTSRPTPATRTFSRRRAS